MRATPLVFGIAMLSVGWASGGGAAQILFSLFGEKVFNAGPLGIGIIWGFAGIGLLIGGAIAYRLGKVLTLRAIQADHRDCVYDSRRGLCAVQPDADHRAGVRVHPDFACGDCG